MSPSSHLHHLFDMHKYFSRKKLVTLFYQNSSNLQNTPSMNPIKSTDMLTYVTQAHNKIICTMHIPFTLQRISTRSASVYHKTIVITAPLTFLTFTIFGHSPFTISTTPNPSPFPVQYNLYLFPFMSIS